jgi:hypothetical protein
MKTASNPVAKTGYIVTDAVLASLTRDYVYGTQQAVQVNASYLRILVAHTQRELEKLGVKRPTQDGSLSTLQLIHDRLYAVILAAVTTADIAPEEGQDKEERRRRAKERNRRSNFARSAKSTLTSYIKAGGKLMSLKVDELTKESLQSAYRADAPGPKSLFERIGDTQNKLEAMVKELAASDEDTAQEFVEQVHLRMAKLVSMKPTVVAKTKIGEIVLHPH